MWQPFKNYLQLIRFDKPIGTLLILWPTLCALWLASGGVPETKYLLIFVLGSFVMRSAGCIINDIADKDWDCKVKRTKERPLTSGRVSLREAVVLLFVFCLFALILVLQLNQYCLYIAFVAIGITFVYPFTKRWLHSPQLFLGLAFSTSILMAFAAVQNRIPSVGWWFYLSGILWPIAYDTLYAMVDRDDDIIVGIKSTAIWFGRFDRAVVFFLQTIVLVIWWMIGLWQSLSWPYFVSLTAVGALFLYQQWLARNRQREACFKAFLNNHWVGLVLFWGYAAAFYVR